ncbi:MAG: O-antigen ligase family protein [Candidatus Aminicenantes bacterium]|nr:O-antigen ligase family protein [Candidatus Aminicenantes bacterium]
MPPYLALIIVLSFISCVIYIEHKRAKNQSGAVWIVFLWILYSESKGLGTFFNIKTTVEAGSLPDRLFILALGIISLLILLKRQYSIYTILKLNGKATVILIYMLISILWSKYPAISFRRWGREAIAFIIASLLCSEKYPIKMLISALKKAIYSALPLSILLIKYFPEYGRSYRKLTGEVSWEGIASQKNGLVMICSLSILFLCWSLTQDLRNWKTLPSKFPVFIDVFFVMLAFYLMMGPRRTLTYSATSFFALIVGLIFFIFLKMAIKYGISIEKKFMLIAIFIISIGIVMPFSGKIPIKALPKLLNRNETLTGRTEIWNSLIPYANQNLLLGHGFGGFWTTALRNEIASHAHNGYLNTILNLGLCGLLLFIIFILDFIKKSFKLLRSESQIAFFSLSLILVLIIRNISEVSLGEFSTYSTWLLLSLSFIY